MPGENLVLNGGFETGDLTDWSFSDPEPQNPDIGVDNQPADVHSGNYGLFAGNQPSSLSQNIATTVGHTYNVSFYLNVYQSAAFDGSFTATFGGQTVTFLSEPDETDSFMQYSAEITATSSLSDLEFQFSDPGGYYGLDDVSVVDENACYLRGTRLRTDRGDVAIEALRIGDLLATASGALRPIRWIGRRALDCARHRDPASVWPIRVRAGAFDAQTPSRDLWLSPGHYVVAEGALTPVSALLNGVSVAQIESGRLEYWHVELDSHDIIFAEGLAAESYLDTGNRAAFDNGGAFVEAHPDFAPRHWADTCLPLVFHGPAVAATRARLLARLEAQGLGFTRDADPHVVVDGVRVDPIERSETRLGFVLPRGGREIALRSRTFVPALALAESGDTRSLGLCIGALRIDDDALALDQPLSLADGWHDAEFADGRFTHRWTQGHARLRAGARRVVVDLVGQGRYRREPEPSDALCA